ncbi:MAG: amidohydrolase family protein [Vicinamibacterales bacterium]|nr:amidohydrolase family protein [Vicinamibacterales bacterium]
MATRLATLLVVVIVGATLIAGLIVGAQRADANGPVDLIIVNGKVYPGGGKELQEAVAVRGNQILRVGSNREVKRLRRAQTLVLDAHGAAVIPGLNDGHVRLMSGALALERLDLSPARTTADLETDLRHYAEDAPARPWVLGRNGNATLLTTTHVTARKVLDSAVHDRPVFVTSQDGSVAWANSMALEKAGINRRTRNPVDGIVVKDHRTGEPTGLLKDAAVDLVERVLPKPTRAEKTAALLAAIAEGHRLGVTSMHTMTSAEEELDLLNAIREDGDLTMRVYSSISVGPGITEAEVASLDELRREYPDDPLLKLGGVEIVCAKRGRITASACDPATLDRAVALLDKHEWNVTVRTVDGADVRAAVDAFDHAATTNPASARNRRYRVDETLLSDGTAHLLFGSSWPAAPLDPREAIEQTVTTPAELKTAIDAYTTQVAYASRDDQRKGTIAAGMLADIVILSNNIFENPPESLRETAVSVTIFDGKIVYQRPAVASDD